ncbi:MAG: ABC transporter substrate-binding protein [Litorilinea sp.]
MYDPLIKRIRSWLPMLVLAALMAACAPAPASQTAPDTADTGAETAADTPAGEPVSGGTLYIGQDFGPQTFDPHKNLAWASINIYESIYNGLVKWNEDETELVPDLATAWEISEDGLVYTFTIRQGVTFHNGREMTAEDVKFSIDRLRDPDVSVHAAKYNLIESVDVLDAETVQITLSQPFGTLLLFLVDRYSIIPMEAVDTLETDPVGTGPFMLEEYAIDQHVRLVRNPDYYEEGYPLLDAVEFKILGDEASKESALRTRSVDMVWFRDPRQAEAVVDSVDGLVSQPGIPSRYIDIRLNLCEAPFDDVRVRRALSLAMNRELLIETVIPSRYGGAVSGIVEPSSPFFATDTLPYYEHDVEAARALLAEAGYPDGITIEEPYKVVAANQLDVDAAQVLQQMWAAAGIEVTIAPMEVGQILDDWRTGNGLMVQVGNTWEPDPDTRLYAILHSDSPIAQAYCWEDAEMDSLLEAGRATVDRDERAEIYRQLQERVADQAYSLVLYGYPLRWEVWWDDVMDYNTVPSNSRWATRYTWLNR